MHYAYFYSFFVMNWLSYQRLDVKSIEPYSNIIIVGSQRQSIRDIIRCIEPSPQRCLILDNLDYHGTYLHDYDPHDMCAHFHPAFLQRIASLPPNSILVLDMSLFPKDAYQHITDIIHMRQQQKITLILLYSQTYMIPPNIADSADYAFLHRITSHDQAFRLFGRFFPDIQEFLYAIEQYAKYYEALFIDNKQQKALWYRPSHV
jgi:hypothetical protein